MDHVEFQVANLNYPIFKEFKQFNKYKVSKKLSFSYFDCKLENNLVQLKEIAACPDIKLVERIRIDPQKIGNA